MLCQSYLTISKNVIKNLTVNYISCIDEGLIKISNLLHGASDGQKGGNKPRALIPEFGTVVQSYVYCYPAGCS